MKTNELSTIVVGVDLSDYSKCVVHQAKKLAQKLKLKVIYVYAIEGSEIYQTAPSQFFEKLMAEQAEKVQKMYGLKGDSNLIVRLGHPEKLILKTASGERNPLILVGHKGRNAISRFFLGSVAEQLAASTPFPLWIHRGDKTVLPKSILIPSDLSKKSDKTLLRIQPLQLAFQAKIEAFHVVEEPTPVMDYTAWAAMAAAIRKDDTRRLKLFTNRHPDLKITQARGAVVENIGRQEIGRAHV